MYSYTAIQLHGACTCCTYCSYIPCKKLQDAAAQKKCVYKLESTLLQVAVDVVMDFRQCVQACHYYLQLHVQLQLIHNSTKWQEFVHYNYYAKYFILKFLLVHIAIMYVLSLPLYIWCYGAGIIYTRCMCKQERMLKAAAYVAIATDILQISDCMYYTMPVYMTLCDCSLETYGSYYTLSKAIQLCNCLDSNQYCQL